MQKKIGFLFLAIIFSGLIAAKAEFAQGFLKGTAQSFYQNGGHNSWDSLEKKPQSNWTQFENSKIRFHFDGVFVPWPFPKKSPIAHGEKVGIASDGWRRAFDDIHLIKKLGCNAHRFSVEWTDIEPQEGVFNQEALAFYERYCDALIANGIEPMVTLHHFVHPLWFEKRGGFLPVANVHYFVRYAKKVFERLGGKVRLWCTINEPTVVSACGYILGIHAPGKVLKLYNSGIVLKNLLKAHVDVYKALKKMPGGRNAQIGLVHQAMQFEPYRHKILGLTIVDPIGKQVARGFNFSFAHNAVLGFLKTGVFEYRPSRPLRGIRYTNPAAPKSYDFIGLNFYSKVILGPGPTCYKNQVMTDMQYAIRPETLYDAIKQVATLGKPIYITENGIPDAKDDRREAWIKGYVDSVHQAVRDGFDVRGYFYWSLIDNFEWSMGFDQKFGLYQVHERTKNRTLRKGAYAYRDYFTTAHQNFK